MIVMINNVKESILSAKEKIKKMLASGDIECTYYHSGHIINGLIIPYKYRTGSDQCDVLNDDIRVRSKTKKEYSISISKIISINGVKEL